MSQIQTTKTAVMYGVGWLFRFVLFILTSGFAYPHVCTEGMDLT